MPVTLALKPDERAVLKAAVTPAYTGNIPRSMLEKLLRLDLIEPGAGGMCMTLKGKTVLSTER